jgi:hypothetical protein
MSDYRIPLLLLISIVLGCTNEIKDPEIITTNDFVLSDSTKEHLLSLYTQVVDNPEVDELLFANYGSSIGVIITDYDGNFVRKIGEKGRGPKEILSSRFFGAKDSAAILILDKKLGKFKLYNSETEVVQLFDYTFNQGVSITSRGISFCKEKWFSGVQLIGKPTLPSVPTIAVFDTAFSLIDTLGGYDPYFDGRDDILQETTYSLDCENGVIYTVQGKTPKIQAFSIHSGNHLGSTEITPPLFKVSDKFISMSYSSQSWARYLSEEQSISLHLSHDEHHLFLVYRNDSGVYKKRRALNESEHIVAVFNKESFDYLGEVKVPGAILGSTKKGELIMLKDEEALRFQFIKIIPSDGN